MKFFLVAGLPASGKSTWAKEQHPGANFVDDPKGLGDIVLDETKVFTYIVDPFFCLSHIRQQAETILFDNYPGCDIQWIFFENNPVQCLVNAKNRTDKKVDNFIEFLSKRYNIPGDSIILPVWEKDNVI